MRTTQHTNPAENTAPTLVLVGCVGRKRTHPMAARDLYDSPLFDRRRSYAERSGCPWAIVTARLPGLLSPDEVVGPYDLRIDSYTSADLEIWRAMLARRSSSSSTASRSARSSRCTPDGRMSRR